jgi:hypothetical protein
MFQTVAVRLIENCTLLFLTGEDDIARLDSWRYNGVSVCIDPVDGESCFVSTKCKEEKIRVKKANYTIPIILKGR